jgi:AraC family transcriptional regulator
MNYYQSIQKAIDIIESNLKDNISIEKIASESCMSLATFYRVFYYIVGDSIYSYIKKRRLSESALEIMNTDKQIIEISFEYQYEAHEAFTRAFKSFFKKTPLEVRRKPETLKLFRRINIMKNYNNLIKEDSYAVKEIVELKPTKVASCHIIGENPEINSAKILIEWAKKNDLPSEIGKVRFFGFNNDEPDSFDGEVKKHGYETLMTIDNDVKIESDEKIKIKNFEGGLYATMQTSVKDVGKSWKMLIAWVDISKYEIGEHQCLEEVLSFDFENEENTKLRLFIPIK